MKYSDGREFRGDFKDGLRHCGSLKFTNGDLYDGMYDDNGLMSGGGRMSYANGDFYSGDFVHGLMHGNGKMKYSDGAMYYGQFQYDLIDGDGEYTYPDSTYYAGQFREGLQHGMGCLSNEKGETQLFGYWTDGEFSADKKPVEPEIEN